MFVQVIQGPVSDAAALHAAFDRWIQDLAPSAAGWLGTTAGVTDDGRFMGIARFESDEAARRNSNRPEQDAWWSQTSTLFTGEATFTDSTDVDVDIRGEPDDAGFVQVIQGRSSDPDRAKELMGQDSADWAAFRPDIIGSVGVGHPEGGGYTTVVYFTSEEEAREGERKEPPPAIKALMDEMNALNVGTPEFFDLKEPWLYSPR